VLVDSDEVYQAFDNGPCIGEVVDLMTGWQNPDMRRVIDRAIEAERAKEART
jgi:hypothetical protein